MYVTIATGVSNMVVNHEFSAQQSSKNDENGVFGNTVTTLHIYYMCLLEFLFGRVEDR